MEQEQAEKQRLKEEAERRRKAEERKRKKRMLEAAFDGDVDAMEQILKEVRLIKYHNFDVMNTTHIIKLFLLQNLEIYNKP